MSEIGSLIIKLQAQTAEFREDMGKVKSDLNDLKDGAGSAGDAVDGSMRDSAGSVRLLTRELGIPLPRELSRLIATIPAVGAAFSAMLPVIGIVAAIVVIDKLIEHQKAVAEQAHKLAISQESFGTTVQDAFNKLDDKLLEAGVRADELRGNHLAALQKQLQLIDHESLRDLSEQFNIVAQAAEKTLGLINEHWYESKIGVVGVKDALENFKAQYDSLLAQGKDK
ncbi:MAG: hypothetical protein WCC37_25950, partial [Candidatus Sulfotelmatobacter sp.]